METGAVSDVMILENALDGAWNHKLRLMAGKASALDGYPVPAHATVKRYEDDLHLHRLDASWPARELVRVPVMGDAYRLVVAWWIGSDRLSQAMVAAGEEFAVTLGVNPNYAFMRSIPAVTQEFVEVKGICLVQCGWVPTGFVVVTAGGMTPNLPAFKVQKMEMTQ